VRLTGRLTWTPSTDDVYIHSSVTETLHDCNSVVMIIILLMLELLTLVVCWFAMFLLGTYDICYTVIYTDTSTVLSIVTCLLLFNHLDIYCSSPLVYLERGALCNRIPFVSHRNLLNILAQKRAALGTI